MIKPDTRRIVPAAAVVAAVIVMAPGCSPKTEFPGEVAPDSPLEIECARELVYLDGLLETRRLERGFSPAVLAETYALRQSAAELILDEEYELALELINEAIALLRES